MSALPTWLPMPEWNGYIAMRKKKRAVMTDRAIELRLADLKTMLDEGQDIAAVLDQSTANGWTDVYPVKEKRGAVAPKLQALGKHGQATANNLMDWLGDAV